MRHHLFKLQQKLSITAAEAFALLTLAGLFMLGLGVRYWNTLHPPDYDATYATIDSLMDAGTMRLEAELALLSDSTSEGARVGGLVDLNNASAAELQSLPRIGPAIASRILEYRSSHGRFGSVEELTRISGIGPKTLETLKPLLQLATPDST